MPTDKKRLDWLAKNRSSIFVCGSMWCWWNGAVWVGADATTCDKVLTPRQAIDAAMRSGTRKVKPGQMKPPSRGWEK